MQKEVEECKFTP
jgi:hypothetical protein